jgi:hypothetical protein
MVLPLSCSNDEPDITSQEGQAAPTSFQAEACVESDVNQLMFLVDVVESGECGHERSSPFICTES